MDGQMNQKPGLEPPTGPRAVVLIPARNEATTIATVVRHVKTIIDRDIVVIDDASTDATASLARAAGATVLPLPLRLGAWGATQTGIRYALRTGYQIAVTMDADGQHDAADIERAVPFESRGQQIGAVAVTDEMHVPRLGILGQRFGIFVHEPFDVFFPDRT
jgi:glycosyltransferase involved in cell wall biosynthesis